MSEGLRRRKERLEEDWGYFCTQTPALATTSCSPEQAKLANQKIEQLSNVLDQVMRGIEEEELSVDPGACQLLMQEKRELWSRMSRGFRQAGAQICGRVKAGHPRGEELSLNQPRRGISRLERISLPRFSGRLEEYADFKRVFQELTQSEAYPDCFMLTQMRERLPKEAVALLAGVTCVATAWKQLDRRFGNREQAIMQAKHRLWCVKVGNGAAFEQLENLRIAVQIATAHLEAVGGGAELFADSSIFGVLLGKIPFAYQERWHLLSTNPRDVVVGETTGMRFRRWLEREGEAANAARLQQMGNALIREEGGFGAHAVSRTREQATLGAVQTESFGADGIIQWREPMRTREAALEVKENLVRKLAPCPACQEKHTYERKFIWGTEEWPSQRFEACPLFLTLTPTARAKLVEDQGGCGLCTAWGHVASRCFMKEKNRQGTIPDVMCKEGTSSGACQKSHHRLLHGSGNAYCQA